MDHISLGKQSIIVIVHGAFLDGSAWKSVYTLLAKKGYHVSIVQNPLTSLDDDVEATKRILDEQDGPVVLVGNSWAGTVITQAGVDPKVVALVYVAALQPDKGETSNQWLGSRPSQPLGSYLILVSENAKKIRMEIDHHPFQKCSFDHIWLKW